MLPPITILDEEGGQGGEGPEGQGQNGGGEGSEAGEMLVEEAEGPEEGEEDQISPLTLVLIVFLYLVRQMFGVSLHFPSISSCSAPRRRPHRLAGPPR